MIRQNIRSVLAVILILATTPVIGDVLKISDAWIKNLPPVVPMRAGYMTIENNTDQAIKIIGAESEVFTAVEIHETIEKDGMMSMQPVSILSIPAGTEAKLTPGGMHLMMMQPEEDLKPGDLVSITLKFDDGSTQTLQMTVRK